VTIAEQYIHKMRLDIPGGPLPIQFIDDHVKAVWYTDLAVRFTIPHGDGNFELFGNVNNLFDKKPPLIPGTVPGVNEHRCLRFHWPCFHRGGPLPLLIARKAAGKGRGPCALALCCGLSP
jgi:hypothetical protein